MAESEVNYKINTIPIKNLASTSNVNDSDIMIIEDATTTYKIKAKDAVEYAREQVKDTFIQLSEKGAMNGVTPLNDNMKVDPFYLPFGKTHGTIYEGSDGQALEDTVVEHITDKNNPHEVTKSQIGLGNVENKSSETIRSEITSKNVTDALGFTPEIEGAYENSTAYTDEKIKSLVDNASAYNTLGKIEKELNKINDDVENLDTVKADKTDLTAHTNNKVIHVTQTDKDNLTSVMEHAANKNNPHEVTKVQIGLGNVENKSSATIRGELTSKNVTDALGFVPEADGALESAKSYTDIKVSELIGGASEIMDTFKEVEEAFKNNEEVVDALNAAIGTKTDKTDFNAHIKDTIAHMSQAQKTNLSDAVAHMANKNNPHEVTKAQVGLGNVENKSSATIRSELTAKNVTDALGFVPETDGALESAKSYTDSEIKKVSSSINTSIDGITTDITNINKDLAKKANQAELDTHVNNSVIHVTQTDKNNLATALAHAQSAHARTDATKVENSTTNGNIKINGSEASVYQHPLSGASAGTYRQVTVDTQGHVTGGSNPILGITQGGTGATTAAGALTNLGLTATASELNKLDGTTVTTTELNYVHGVTSNIQTQLNGKAPTNHGNHLPAIDSTTNKKFAMSNGIGSEWHQLAKQDIIDALGFTPGVGSGNVTGVKGSAESSYRTGNVNITPENIGLGKVNNTADSEKSVASAAKLSTARKIGNANFDGTADITLSQIGAAAASHGTHVSYSTSAPLVAGTASAGSSANVSRGDHVHPAQTSVSGNAGTATKLANPRSIALGTGAIGTATNFDGSGNITIPVTNVYEAYLSWGGKNHAGSFAPIDAAMVPMLGADRLAFAKPAGITIEYSRDSGSTWTDYGASDGTKLALFTPGGSANVAIGKADSTNKATAAYQLRITLDSANAQVYTALNKFCIYLSTNGSTGTTCSIDIATKAAPTTWKNIANNVAVSGWSGYNIINVPSYTTYGNQDSQYLKTRFTFKCTGGSTTYNGTQISNICGYGGVGWTAPSNMARIGHLYSYDQNQNATFPAAITATKFNGSLTGDVTGNVSGTAGAVAWANVTGKPSTFPSTSHTHDDRYYTESEVDSKLSGKAASSHTHTKSQITDFPTIPSVGNGTITITQNGTTKGSFTMNQSGNATIALTDTNTDTNTTYSPGTGLSLTGTAFSVKYGTAAGTACEGNDSRLSNARPASDVSAWAKAASKPAYSWSEIGSKPSTFPPSSHSHAWADITGKPSSYYTLPAATASALGGVKVGSNITNSSGTISLTKANVVAALGYTPPTSDTNTTYGVVSKSANGLCPALPNETATTKYLRQDGTWVVPPNTVYSHPTSSGNKHIPSGGSSGQILRWSADGTAAWGADNNTDTKNTAGSTNSTSKLFLVGATSQAANPTTNSNSKAYIGTDNCLYSNGQRIITQLVSATEPTGLVNGDYWIQEIK